MTRYAHIDTDMESTPSELHIVLDVRNGSTISFTAAADGKLYLQETQGDKIHAEIPLGDTSHRTFSKLISRLKTVEEILNTRKI